MNEAAKKSRQNRGRCEHNDTDKGETKLSRWKTYCVLTRQSKLCNVRTLLLVPHFIGNSESSAPDRQKVNATTRTHFKAHVCMSSRSLVFPCPPKEHHPSECKGDRCIFYFHFLCRFIADLYLGYEPWLNISNACTFPCSWETCAEDASATSSTSSDFPSESETELLNFDLHFGSSSSVSDEADFRSRFKGHKFNKTVRCSPGLFTCYV